MLALAVKNHSSKSVTGTPVEEIVKDADVVDCYMSGIPLRGKSKGGDMKSGRQHIFRTEELKMDNILKARLNSIQDRLIDFTSRAVRTRSFSDEEGELAALVKLEMEQLVMIR
jgi:hypothetical protein